jgi:molybdopterin/thiamine biosynthesis adenylyltransferase
MGYLYRNPQLQIDLPQPEPDSRLVLNLETRRYLRLGLREFDWLKRIEGQVEEDDVADLFGIDASLAQELTKRLIAARLIYVSADPVQIKSVPSVTATQLETRRLEWVHFGQLRLHLGRPKRILESLRPVVRFMMHRITAFAVVLLSLTTLFLLVGQAPEIVRAMRGFTWNASHVVEVMAMLFVVTILHEFGHAAACDYFGAPVRSIGVMLFYLQPAAYADVTDSWQLSNRWDRVAISFAGIYVQIVLTNFLMVIWFSLRWAHRPTDILVIFMSINFSIILLNLMPFSRLDGYWILSNVIAIPNLRNRAEEWTRVNLFAAVKRRPVQAKDLRYSAVLNMSPTGQTLLLLFGLTSMVFGASMWIAGIGFLLRATRWMNMRTVASYVTVGAVLAGLVAMFFVRRWFDRRRSRAEAPQLQVAPPKPAIVVHRIDPKRPVQLNPYVQVITNGKDGRVAFGQFSGNPLIVNASNSLFDLLPDLRTGQLTMDDVRQHPSFRPEFEDILQRLWHQKLLRYAADWECAGDQARHSRIFGWMSNNTLACGRELAVLERLQRSRVTVLGIGGLGTHVVWNLAACGVGELHLVDGDTLELSNLNRQTFFTAQDVGRFKVDVAAEYILRLNPQIKVRKTCAFLRSADELADAIKGSDHVVRALDTPVEVPVMVNEACVRMRIPYTGAGFFGQGSTVGPTVIPGVSSCLACHNSDDGVRVDRGTFGSIAPVISSTAGFLANEVVTCLGGIGTAKSINRLIWIDAPELNFRFQDLEHDENCSVCGTVALKRLVS